MEGELGSPLLPFLPHLLMRWAGGVLSWHAPWRCARTLPLTVPRLGGVWWHSGGGERASLPWRRTVCSPISIFSLTAWARRRNVSVQGRIPPRRIRFSWPVRWTLAASIYCPAAKRCHSDAGASRDLLESFLEGLERWMGSLRDICKLRGR